MIQEIARLLIISNLPDLEYNNALEMMAVVHQDVLSFRKGLVDLSPEVRSALVVYKWYKSYD